MAEPKNPFDFGTGSIDKDQWLRDIDAEQDEFISRYSNAVNKHRATLLRDAFADLRRRIANGDMLNRTADGQYQFGSALNREDKHMQEAYQRALGFMGGLARRQIQTPPPEPEKKAIGSLEERYIKSLNPSGKFNTEAYWKNQTDKERRTSLSQFLNNELSQVKSYQDFGNFGDEKTYTDRLTNVIKLLDSENANDWTLQQLGFTKNWLTQPTGEQEVPKGEQEQLQEELAQLQQQEINNNLRAQIERTKNKGLTSFSFAPGNYDWIEAQRTHFGNNYALSGFETPWGGSRVLQPSESDMQAFYASQVQDLYDYFNNFGTNYPTLYKNDPTKLGQMLAMLTSKTTNDKTKQEYYTFYNTLKNFLTPMSNGTYFINGSNNSNGRFARYIPGGPNSGIQYLNYEDLTDEDKTLYKPILGYKEGGQIQKLQNGDPIRDAMSTYSRPKPSTSYQPASTQQDKSDELEESNEEMDFGKIMGIAGPLALDIASMISANGVGIGTLISAGTGVASTALQGVNDWDNNNILGSLGSIGANLLADGVGLIPGLGIAGKVGKIAKGLAKNAKYFGYAFNAIGAKDASQVLYKGVKNGFDLSPDEWKTLAYGLAGVAQGAAGVKRANRTNLKREAATQQVYNSTNKKGETYPVVVGIGDATPGKTGKSRYIANKNDILKIREKTLTPDWSGSMDKSFVKIMQQPRSSVILHSWESLNNPFRNPFSLEKSRNKFNSFAEQWGKRKSKPSNTTETPSEKYGGVLKALRNGGIIKAEEGLKTDGLTNKYDNISDWTKLNFGVAEKQYFPGFMKARYDNRGNVLYPHSSFPEQEEGEHFGDQSTESAYKAQQAYYLKDNGAHIFGDVQNAYNTWKSKNNGTVQDFINYYNGEVDWLRSWGQKKLQSEANSKGWRDYNQRFNNLYGSYSPYDSKLEDIIGESTWQRTPNTFKGITDLANLRQGVLGIGDGATQVAIDNQGHLITDSLINPKGDIKETKKENDKKQIADSERSEYTLYNTNFKNPTDPTPWFIAGKTALGLLGNRNIYKNLLDEMPQAPLRDPINRQLAIVGWQERVKSGQNQLADLRRIQQKQQGSDQQTNFATALETERVGRDIMNKAFQEDSGRQFETAQKLWNLKNEDVLYNLGVGDANRRSIADRARMMAQIRAAWRSGDSNILMGALSDTGNWLLKKYQREQDLINLAREQQLGTKEQFMEDYLKLKNPNYAALKTEYETTKDINRKKQLATQIQEMQIKALREAPSAWAQKVYSNFHTPGFGGGYKETIIPISKDGSKLEVAKLKARSKDNDRYVSMIKDLRHTSYRRRRRR